MVDFDNKVISGCGDSSFDTNKLVFGELASQRGRVWRTFLPGGQQRDDEKESTQERGQAGDCSGYPWIGVRRRVGCW